MAERPRGLGPKAPVAPAPSTPPRAQSTPARAPAPHLPPAPRGFERPDDRGGRQGAEAQLLGDGRIGDPTITSAELSAMGSLVAGRHLMTLLAKRRAELPREAVIAEAGELLLGLEDPVLARRLLLEMGDLGRIVDVYPLEVMVYVMERRAGILRDIARGTVVLNTEELTGRTFAVEEVIRFKVPLSLKMRAFAVEGGAAPGYCFSPGAPAEYLLEVAAPGPLSVLVRGDIRKKSLVDRVILQIEDPPEPEGRW